MYASTYNIYKTGIYEYSLSNLSGTAIMSVTAPLLNCGRSYNLMKISRSTGDVTIYPIFDVFGSTAAANNLAATLNALDSSVIVIIFTYDEPFTNSSLLVSALKRCGASSTFNTFILYRSAYVLVGIPGIGVNNGLQRYSGAIGTPGDPNALVNLRISITDGDYTYISG